MLSSALLRLFPLRLYRFAAFLVLVPLPGFAQGRGTLFGVVSDANGAVVAKAQLTLTEVATQQKRSAESDKSGDYTFSTLSPGRYQLSAIAPGFEAFAAQNITLEVDENRQLAVKLSVGAVTQQVTVSDQTGAQVETRTAAISEVVDSERVRELPLNGRNVLQLQYLVAGAAAVSAGGGGQAESDVVAINGNRQNANNYTLDGADNEDPFFNTPSVLPNPDALDQFSMKTSNYGAQEGRGSGSQMNAVTRSGTNQFHGVLFDYLRNDAMDARGYFAGAVKPPLRRNQFGGTAGGPLRRDRIFFFGAYQGTRQSSSPNAVNLVVPSAAERKGDFAELLPTTQLRIPGTTTPAPENNLTAYVDPAAVRFLNAFVPLPNRPGNQYVYNPASSLYEDQYTGKVDAILGGRDVLSGRFIYVENKVKQVPNTTNLPGFLAQINYTNKNLAVNETHTFSPNLINVFTFGWNDIARHQLPIIPQQVSWADFGAGIVRAVNTAPVGWDTTVSGYFSSLSRWPLNQLRSGYQYSDSFTWTRGAHSFAFGGDVRSQFTDQSQTFQSDSALTFNGTFTKNSLADLLVGRMSKITQQSFNGGKPTATTPDLFAEDDWRITPRLSLNLGLRWEPFVPLNDRLNRVSQYRAGEQSTVLPKAPLGYVFPGDAGVPTNTFSGRWNVFAPRIGFAFSPSGDGRTSVRAAYGIYNASIRSQALNNVSTNLPFAYSLSISSPSGGLSNPYSDVGGNPFPFTPPAPAAYNTYNFGTPLAALTDFAPDFRNARVHQWNLNVQQQLPGEGVLTLAYVGTTGEHLFATVEENPAVANKPGATTQARRLNPAFTTIAHQFAGGHSTYHALQSTYNKRMSHGITVLANYTWARSIDNGSDDSSVVFNPFNISAARGLSDFDVRHSFVASLIWTLPQPHSNSLLARGLAKGWELNGIAKLSRGSPFSVLSGADNSRSGVNLDLADRLHPSSVFHSASRAQQVSHWFDTAAFTANAAGTFGDSGRNSLIAPGIENIDLGFSKVFPASERTRLLFRTEAFNLLNHTNLAAPNATLTSASFGTITSLNPYGAPRVVQVALRLEF